MKRCSAEAGGCGRTEQEGAVLRGGSSLCEACKEAIAESGADDAAKLEEARAVLSAYRARKRTDSKERQLPNLVSVVSVQQLADAFHEVGKVNHYMVGVVYRFSAEELEEVLKQSASGAAAPRKRKAKRCRR